MSLWLACFFFFQVIDELTSKLERREVQLLTVSKDKARLEEECDNLKEWVRQTQLLWL